MSHQIFHWTSEVVAITSWICGLFFLAGLALRLAAGWLLGEFRQWASLRYVRQAVYEKKAREHKEQA